MKDYLSVSGGNIYINNETFSIENIRSVMQDCNSLDEAALYNNFLYLQDVVIDKNEIDFAVNRLNEVGETILQKEDAFRDIMFAEDMAIDTSNGGYDFVQFHILTNANKSFPRSGKSDATCGHGPLFLELKHGKISNVENSEHSEAVEDVFCTLVQGIDRLAACMDVRGYLTKSFALAVTVRSCYVIKLSRNIVSGKIRNDLNIYKTNPRYVYRIWARLAAKMKADLSYFLMPYFNGIQSVLNDSLGINVLNVRVTMIGFSCSPVFSISLADSEGNLPTDNSCDFVVKVAEEVDKGLHEIKMLKAVDAKYGEHKVIYALHYVSVVAGKVQDRGFFSSFPKYSSYMAKKLEEHRAMESKFKNFIWNNTITNDSTYSHYNAILMIPGVSDPAESDFKKKIENVYSCLQLLHEHTPTLPAVCHCDVRDKNIMYFPFMKEWQAIDFDMSCLVGESVLVSRDYGQYKALGPRALSLCSKSTAKKISIEWKASDDVEMLFRYLLDSKKN